MRYLLTFCLSALMLVVAAAVADSANWPAVVHKRSVEVHAKADFGSPVVATLKRDDNLTIAAQQGLWYAVELAGGKHGYLRVNDVRVEPGHERKHGNAMKVLLTARSGGGHVTETAGVRGLNESTLKSAAFNGRELAAMESNRVSAREAARYAKRKGWHARKVAWDDEVPSAFKHHSSGRVHGLLKKAHGLFGMFGSRAAGVANVVEKAAPESAEQIDAQERALGPMIAGRLLGARHLWNNREAQHRVNVIGRWLASQTSRPDLPWTFAVIDSPQLNAFAAPGGYIFVTRGLYQIADSDEELAGVLGHEITHVVQGDHFQVIRKQETAAAAERLAASEIHTGGGLAGELARDYVEKNGAAILATSLDRSAEYRADQIGEVYLARAGMDPLALYAMLQKMLAVGSETGGLEALYATHPPLDKRLDRLDRTDLAKLEPRNRRR